MKWTIITFGEYVIYGIIAGILLFMCSSPAPAQSLSAFAPLRECTGTYQVAVTKGTINVPCETMILMNIGTYAGYYQARKNYDSLKLEIPKYRATIDSIETNLSANIADLQHAIKLEKLSKQNALKTALILGKENKELRTGITLTRWLGIGVAGALVYTLIIN